MPIARRVVAGILLILAGTLFGLQGAGVTGGSGGMNGSAVWAVLGPIIAIAGVVLIVRTLRSRSTTR